MNFDLHIHTARHSPDSEIKPFDLVRKAQELGLDGVVITEHDWLWTEQELDELRAVAGKLIVLSGVEVTTVEGHFLAYGVHDPFAIPKQIPVADLCREVHRQGGAVVAAHPFRWGQPFDEILRDQRPELDGMELMTGHMDAECREKAADLFPHLSLAGIGSSDSHRLEDLAVCYTHFGAAIRDNRDLTQAIRSRCARPQERAASVVR
jgi:predicted metal-dependent phosphoesterase TrpH